MKIKDNQKTIKQTNDGSYFFTVRFSILEKTGRETFKTVGMPLNGKGEISKLTKEEEPFIEHLKQNETLGKVNEFVSYFPLIQEKINENALSIEKESLKQIGISYHYLFKMKNVPFTLYFLWNKSTNDRVYLTLSAFLWDGQKEGVEMRIPLMRLLNNRIMDHLLHHSKERLRLLYDPQFDYYRKRYNPLKKGDLVQLNEGVSLEGKTEGIIKSFYISDENAEMAVLDMEGQTFHWFVSGLKKIEKE